MSELEVENIFAKNVKISKKRQLTKAASIVNVGKQFSQISNDPFSIQNLLDIDYNQGSMGILIQSIKEKRNKTES